MSFLREITGDFYKKIGDALGVGGSGSGPAEDPFWIADATSPNCYECETPFSLLVRRHRASLLI